MERLLAIIAALDEEMALLAKTREELVKVLEGHQFFAEEGEKAEQEFKNGRKKALNGFHRSAKIAALLAFGVHYIENILPYISDWGLWDLLA
jgi:hypothetical protein